MNRRLVIAGVVVALVGFGFWFVSWWSHPTVFGDRTGVGFQASPQPLPDATLHAGLTVPDPDGGGTETITFRSVSAHFSENSAHATASFAVCVPYADAEGPIISANRRHDPTEFCREVRPIVAGTKLRWIESEKGREYIIVTITPTTAGTASLDEVTYDYARGWRHLFQRGEERIGGIGVSLVATDQ